MPTRPAISIVTAVYNVEEYLGDFIASIERQGMASGELEVIAVDDGSTDGSRAVLEAWRDRTSIPVTVLDQENAGQGAARNLGIEHATGEWVTFSDPDDMLGPGYLREILGFARAHPTVPVIAGRPVVINEIIGARVDHARERQYDAGNRVVNLDSHPNVFSGATGWSFYRLDRVRATGLRFSPLVRPNFEDGHFAVRYLLDLPEPIVGLVRSATYLYRRRADGSSSLQLSYRDQGRYTAVFEHGYLDAIARAKASKGRVPAWLQHMLIYELSWYLSEDERISTTIHVEPDVVPRFHALLAQVLRELDPAVVARHTARPLKVRWRDIFAHAGREADWHSPAAVRSKEDRDMGLQRVVYRFTGSRPSERVSIGGVTVAPAWAKTQALVYYRRALMFERILWLPIDGRTRLYLDDQRVPITPAAAEKLAADAAGADDRTARARAVQVLERLGRYAVRVSGYPTRRLARRGAMADRFRDAWVLMDRAYEADDNAERLFEYLRASRPDINAWFTVNEDSVDFARLRDAFGERVVPRGSREWTNLMLNARWLVSSHADRLITRPPELDNVIRRPTWKFAFLQHGVIKDDLSTWLNRRQGGIL